MGSYKLRTEELGCKASESEKKTRLSSHGIQNTSKLYGNFNCAENCTDGSAEEESCADGLFAAKAGMVHVFNKMEGEMQHILSMIENETSEIQMFEEEIKHLLTETKHLEEVNKSLDKTFAEQNSATTFREQCMESIKANVQATQKQLETVTNEWHEKETKFKKQQHDAQNEYETMLKRYDEYKKVIDGNTWVKELRIKEREVKGVKENYKQEAADLEFLKTHGGYMAGTVGLHQCGVMLAKYYKEWVATRDQKDIKVTKPQKDTHRNDGATCEVVEKRRYYDDVVMKDCNFDDQSVISDSFSGHLKNRQKNEDTKIAEKNVVSAKYFLQMPMLKDYTKHNRFEREVKEAKVDTKAAVQEKMFNIQNTNDKEKHNGSREFKMSNEINQSQNTQSAVDPRISKIFASAYTGENNNGVIADHSQNVLKFEVEGYHANESTFHADDEFQCDDGFQGHGSWSHTEVGDLQTEDGGFHGEDGEFHPEDGGFHVADGELCSEDGWLHSEDRGFHFDNITAFKGMADSDWMTDGGGQSGQYESQVQSHNLFDTDHMDALMQQLAAANYVNPDNEDYTEMEDDNAYACYDHAGQMYGEYGNDEIEN